MAGTQRTVLKGVQNPCSQSPLLLEADETLQSLSVNQIHGDMHLHDDHPALAPAKSEARSKVVPQFGVWEGEGEGEGEGEAGYRHGRWFGILWMNIKNFLACLVRIVRPSACQRISLQSGHEECEDFRGPANYAKFSLLDEDLIAERGWSLPPYYGGGRRLTVNQSDNNNNVSQTRRATSLHTESNLMQSNVEATSRRVPKNDTPASCHLPIDHPNQETKVGCWLSWFRKEKLKRN